MDSTLPSQPLSSPIYLNAFSKSHAVYMNSYFLKITRERREGGGGRGERGKRWEAENLLAGHLDLGSGRSSGPGHQYGIIFYPRSLRRHFVEKLIATSRIVGCFLRTLSIC